MVKQLQAIMDRVVIRLDEIQDHTQGGIWLTDDHQQPSTIGTVLSIGENVKSVTEGDKVLFHAFDELPTPEAGVVVLRERSLLGKIAEK